MKQYEGIEVEVVKRKACVKLKCDSCGREAEYPADHVFEWGGSGTASASLEYHYSIDGEYEKESLDLCYECAERIAKAVRRGRFKE